MISINRIASIMWNLLQEEDTPVVNVLSLQECKTKLMGQREQFYSIKTKVVWRLSHGYWQDGFLT